MTDEQREALSRLDRGEPAMWAVVHPDGYTHCMMCDQAKAEQYAVQQRAVITRLRVATHRVESQTEHQH